GGGAAGALSVWFGMSAVFAAGSVLVAALGTYWSCWYLLRFAETAGEVAAIRRFIRISTMTAALVCCSTLLLDRLDVTAWAPLLALCTGMLVVNYQSIVVLTRVMRQMLARDARKRGAVRAPLVYRCL
ncbi:RNA polymerase subunit sigma-70, partial [Xanthomonas hortorum pv. cynarae]|nr:RNA polymerase subunit sigma-70 [Xanthomonas hortorum pv. cynarae]